MAWWWSKWSKLVATSGIIKLYVRMKTCTLIIVFQFYNKTGCPLPKKKKKSRCLSIALLICIISRGQHNSQHSDSLGAGQSSALMSTEGREFFFSIPIQTSNGSHPVLFHGGFPGPFPGVKQLWHDVDFSPPI
jgi:hypothetical protein